MLDVSQAVKEAYAGHRRKNLVIHFPSGNFEDITNENIVSGSTVLTESLCSQEKLKFGLCEAPVFECDVAGIGNIKGETIEVSQQIFALEKCVCDVDIEVFENTAETALTERVYFYNQQDLALLTPPMTIKFGVIFDSFDSDSDCYVSLVRDGYKNGTAHKVTVDNGTPVYEEYEEVLSTSGRRGYVEVTLTGPGSFSVKQVVIYGTTVSIPYGTFVVDSCKRQAGTDIRKIIAYGYTAESFLQAPKLEMLKKKYGILDRINTRSYAITSIGSSAVSYKAIVGDEGICGQFYTVSPVDYFIYSDYTAGDTAIHITYRKITYITAADPGTICQISFSGSLEPYQRADELIGSQYEEIRELATSICVQITAGRTNKIVPLIRLYKDGESCRGIDLIDIYEGNGSIEYLLPVIVEINGTEYSNIDNSALLLRYVNVDGFDFEGHNVTAADNLGDNIRNDIEACLELSGVFGRVNRTGYVDVIAIPPYGVYPNAELYPSAGLYPEAIDANAQITRSSYKQGTLWYDDCMVKPIGRIRAEYKVSGTEMASVEYIGDAYNDHAYEIKGNLLLTNGVIAQDKVLDILQKMYENIAGIGYYPCDFSMRGMPYLMPGDTFDIETDDGSSIRSVILQRTLTGVNALMDRITAKGQESSESGGTTSSSGESGSVNAGSGAAVNVDLLWKNPDPTVSFAAQDITLPDIGGYTFILLVYVISASTDQNTQSVMVPVGVKNIFMGLTSSAGYGRRIAEITDNTTLSFGAAVYNGTSSTKYCIPSEIYGIKVAVNDLTV